LLQQIRLCSTCGLQEAGWKFDHLGVNAKALKPVRKVSRDELFKIRHNILGGSRVGIDEDDKPPLTKRGIH